MGGCCGIDTALSCEVRFLSARARRTNQDPIGCNTDWLVGVAHSVAHSPPNVPKHASK